MNETHAARLAAARFICGLNRIARDRIAIDAYGRLFVDGEEMERTARNRVGILTCILLDCVGGDTDPEISNRLADNPIYRDDTRWVAKRLRNGEMIDIIGDFMRLRDA